MYPKKIPNGVDEDKFWKGWIQSRVFMMPIINLLHKLYAFEPNKKKTVLDVGPHYMGGTTLLKELHSELGFTRLKLDVSVIDLVDTFKAACMQVDPDVDYIVGDVTTLKRKFDIVIASHVIEHVDNPIEFCRALQRVARDYVIIACPWRENPIKTKGHVSTIDKDLPIQLMAKGLEIYTDLSWGIDRECCIFWLPGLASSGK